MRRIRQNLKRTYYLRPYIHQKGQEGNTFHEYGNAIEIQAVIRHASGKLDVAEYGERARYILHMQYEGDTEIRLGDGVCVFNTPAEHPDYQVVKVHGFTEDAFKAVDLEAMA